MPAFLNRVRQALLGQKGNTYVAALIILAMGGLMIPPLMNMAISGFKATVAVYSERTEESYAADAGVRDAMWYIQQGAPWLPAVGETSETRSIDPVNGKTVTYTVTRIPDSTYLAAAYRIESTSTDPVTSHTTIVATDVTVNDFFDTFTQNALTSPASITTKQTDTIIGNVQAPLIDGSSSGTINATVEDGTVSNEAVLGWPTVTSTNDPVERFYFNQISGLTPLSGTVIDLSNPSHLGPLYATGSPSYIMVGYGTLQGIIYVDGSLTIDGACTVNLNCQTIYVAGDLTVMPGAAINGPGSIIAMCDIDFQPNHTNSEYIYLMSICGTINFQPNCTFTGSLAGNATINLQPNILITWQDPNGLDLNLPGSSSYGTGIGIIANWKIQ